MNNSTRTANRVPVANMELLDMLSQPDPIENVHRLAYQSQAKVMLTVIANEVEELCGGRHEQDTKHDGRYARWGTNPGSIRIRSEKFRIRVPRVLDMQERRMHTLQSYQKMRRPTEKIIKNLAEKIFLGIYMRSYDRISREFADSFGLSASTVSRSFKEYSQQVLEELEARDLSEETYVALLFDATNILDKHILICTGVIAEGTKVILGFIELSTENPEAITGFLMWLVEKGFRYEYGILCVMDGGKGIYKAVKDVFGDCAQIQRCTWHKRENMVEKLGKKDDQEALRKELNDAYNQET